MPIVLLYVSFHGLQGEEIIVLSSESEFSSANCSPIKKRTK